jgi:voltage-gated potassium channel Kch
MNKNIVLIIGAGHLAYRLKSLLVKQNNYIVNHTTLEELNGTGGSVYLLENIETFMVKIDAASVAMVYLIDEKDEHNLQMIIAFSSNYPAVAITAALFNENLIPHLQRRHENLLILNPAKIAAPVFVDMLYTKTDNYINTSIEATEEIRALKYDFTLVQKLLLLFTAVLFLAVAFFHFYEKLSWINSLYFVVVTSASVGYGDINVLQSAVISKVAVILLILCSTIFIWMIFSLTIDRFLKQRIELALGRKKYNFSNHVVLCGLGRLGYFIVEELIKRNEKVIIIEQNENAKHLDYFRQRGINIYIGDGRLPKVLSDTGIAKAKALISVISNDFINVEIGLNARTFQTNLKLILRIFDEQMVEKIKEQLNIPHTLSLSAIADENFYAALEIKR